MVEKKIMALKDFSANIPTYFQLHTTIFYLQNINRSLWLLIMKWQRQALDNKASFRQKAPVHLRTPGSTKAIGQKPDSPQFSVQFLSMQ